MRDQSTTEPSRIVPPDNPHRTPWWRRNRVGTRGGHISPLIDKRTRRNRRRRIPTGVLVALLALFALMAGTAVVFSFWHTDLVAVRPGSVEPVPSHITVSGAAVYPPDSEISLVTVRVSRRLTIWQRIAAGFESGVDIEPERVFTGDSTRNELRQRNVQRMETSQFTASVVALEHLGYEIPRQFLGVVVGEAMAGAPAADELERGDVIVGIDGVPVADLEDLAQVLASRDVGQMVALDVEQVDGGSVELVHLELIASPDDADRALIGIGATERIDIGELPVEIAIDSGEIGGPSAGLSLTLGIIDLLTPGELTGDLKVAATGTIAYDGSVGAIGEVDQKAIAATRAGTDLFLVPVSNYDDALSHAGDSLKVVAVASLQEALDALAEA